MYSRVFLILAIALNAIGSHDQGHDQGHEHEDHDHPKCQSQLVCDSETWDCYQQIGLPDRDLLVGIALPPESDSKSPPTEFIAWYTISLEDYGYAGFSLDKDCNMTYSAWAPTKPPNCQRVVSPRIVTQDGKTTPIEGPIITLLPGTRQNETHLDTFFRCQNCFNATSGLDIDFSSHSAPVSLILSPVEPVPLQDVNAPLTFQKSDTTKCLMNFAEARFDDYYSRVKLGSTPVCTETPYPSSSSTSWSSTSTTHKWEPEPTQHTHQDL